MKKIITKIKNIFYTLFFVKSWNLAKIKLNKKNLISNTIINLDINKAILKDKKYYFADPFPLSKNIIFAESISKKNLLGNLVKINLKTKKVQTIPLANKIRKVHYSYPQCFFLKKSTFIFPEVSNWTNPFLLKFEKKKIIKIDIKGLENIYAKDSTFFRYKKIFYIFYTREGNKNKKIEVSYSKSFLGPYSLIKEIKNCKSIKSLNSKRMAGNIFQYKKGLYRFGQFNDFLYGDGVVLYKILKLNTRQYEEKAVGFIKIKNKHGPHTINFLNDNEIILDFYELKFSFFSFLTKIKFNLLMKY